MNVDHTTHPAITALRAEVSALVDEVANQREDIQYLTRQLLASNDRAVLAELLPLVAAEMGGTTWTASDLASRAVRGSTAAAGALAQLIASLDTEAGGLRAFGRLLARIDGTPIGGLRLVRVGTTSRTALYQLHGFEGLETTPGYGAAAR